MKKLKLGSIQKMTVEKKIAEGFVLKHDDHEVFLSDEEAPDNIELNEQIDVFLYNDKKRGIVATSTLPDATLDSYDWGEVTEVVKNLGVFVDIGIEKEMLVSKDDLPYMEKVWPQVGDMLFVSLEEDKKGRLLAKPIKEGEVMEDLEAAPKELLHKETVARVYGTTKAGSFVLTEEGHRGFIHPTERKQEPRLGETVNGRIIDVKEDGTVNISLRPLKQDSMSEDADAILEYLERNGGEMAFHDKSDPDEIRNTFSISKAAFKRALGMLMKAGKIEQKDGITSLKQKKQ
ncbi:CvfB family protein [Thalassobacillus hwangdonensis]|uniref:S1 RNA-binding domain-containing protein n=1 Tax=Thalassobacillus hwangdonensis TaxID=546108 RepID=A0ABW3L198_9BACI